MHKLLSVAASFFLLSQVGYSDELTNNIEFMAGNIDATKTTAAANDDVLIFYDDSVLRSDNAFFDKNTNILVLDGNTESIGYKQIKEQSDHATINVVDKDTTFDNLFLMNENNIWLYTDDATKKGDTYFLGNTLLSSCCIQKPLWKIVFDHSVYDDKAEYMKLYGAKLYMWDMPVFYLPYLGFTTNRERSSGLLFPRFGSSGDQGFIYEQPIFLAYAPNWDIELDPQIRTKRSIGAYATLRFADSADSSGELRIGDFRDFDDYQNSHNLKYQNHYGVELLYDSSKFFDNLPLDFKDGLFINGIYLNDIDYINLQKSKFSHFGVSSFQESRLNYFLNNEDYYAGMNAKYFIDTLKTSNNDTLQILPAVQLHKYYDSVGFLPVYYSADVSLDNYFRPNGTTLRQAEFNLPLEWSTPFLDDYLHLSLSEELYGSKLFFGNVLTGEDNFEFLTNVNKIKLYSDLTKSYHDFIHVIQPSLSYSNLGNTYESPVSFDLLGLEQQKLFSLNLPEVQYQFAFSQYFYDNEMNLKFSQRIMQPYYPNRVYNWGDIYHEIEWNFDNIHFSNIFLYSYEFGKFRSIFTGASWVRDDLSLAMSHAYKKDFQDEINEIAVANNLNLDIGYQVNPKVKVYGGISYELDNEYSKYWHIGTSYTQECFAISASISKNATPMLTQSGPSYNDSLAAYIQLKFIPFATVGSSEEKSAVLGLSEQ
ncbi:MAG: LPS-assembly protein LptD [Sulfurovaceae bacterium]|nr:LPS-assembly protein LptD [Sulfurovaceae bacterium]